MRNIKLTLEYHGANFSGWQIQRNKERTVQAELARALKKICKHEIKLIGSGRTDAGVHALYQTANFHTKCPIPTDELKRALNANLPEDIAVIYVEYVPLKFHSQYSIKSKTYRYVILNRAERSPFERLTSLHYPHRLSIKRMREEAKHFIGRHNFRSFQGTTPLNRERDNTFRTIKDLTIKKRGDFIFIDITADGFLYKMVRNIVSTLLAVGAGRLEPDSTKRIFKSKDRRAAPETIRPQGLFLLKTEYARIIY